MRIRHAVGDATDIGLLSAGSAAILLIGSAQLSGPAFANLGLLMTGQVVINLLARAAYGEPLLVIPDRSVARRLLRLGIFTVALTTVLLVLAATAMFPVPLPFLLMVASWSVAWFLLDFSRCLNVAMPVRRGAAGAAAPALVIAAFALAVVAQWRGHAEWGFGLWAGACLAALALGMRLAAAPRKSRIRVAAMQWHGSAPDDRGYAGGGEHDSRRGYLDPGSRYDPQGSDPVHAKVDVGRSPINRGSLRALQRRFVLDALALQVAVQLAILIVALIGARDVAAVFRLSQILYFPASIATLAVQTRTIAQLSVTPSGTAWSRGLALTLGGWALPATLAMVPAVALLPGPAKWLALNLPATYWPMLAVLPVIVAMKCSDVVQNYGVAFLRGVRAHRASSFQRRLWGGCAAAAIVGTTPFDSTWVTFTGAMIVAVACAGLAAVTIIRGILVHRQIPAGKRESVKPSATVVCGNLLGRNFGDDLMLAGLLLEEPRVSTVLVQRLAPVPSWLGRQPTQVPWTFGNAVRQLRSADRLVVAGGTHLAFRRREPVIRQLRVLVSWALFTLIARWLDTEVHMRAVGVGPIESLPARLLIRFTLLGTTQVSVRDAGSESLCRVMGIETTHEPDLAYRYLHQVMRSVTRFSDRGELPFSGDLFVAPASSGFELDYWVDHALELLSKETGIKRIVVAASEVYGSRSDVARCDQLANQLRDKSSIPVKRVDYKGELEEFLALLAGADVVLAARYHVVLAARELARTVVPVEYHPKVTQLLLEAITPGQPLANLGRAFL